MTSTLGIGEMEVQFFCHCKKNPILFMNPESSDSLPNGAEEPFTVWQTLGMNVS